jgi:hypothetical protein
MKKYILGVFLMAGTLLIGASSAKALVANVTGAANTGTVVNTGSSTSSSASTSGMINESTALSGTEGATNGNGNFMINFGSGTYQNGSATGTVDTSLLNSLKAASGYTGTGNVIIDLTNGTYKDSATGKTGTLNAPSLDAVRALLGQDNQSSQSSSHNAAQTRTTTSSRSSDDGIYQGSQPMIIIVPGDASGGGETQYGNSQGSGGANGTVNVSVIARPADVASQDNLKSYSSYTVQNDPNIEKLQIDENGMNMLYRQPGKFISFIPTHVLANVVVDKSGTVDVHYPWYTFMTKKPSAKILKPAIQAKVNAVTAVVKAHALKNMDTLGNGGSIASLGGTANGTLAGNITTDAGSDTVMNGADVHADIMNYMSPETKAELIDTIHSSLMAYASVQ